MKKMIFLVAITLMGFGAQAEVKLNEPAPLFSVKDTSGKIQSLKDHQGKWIVLEWYNKDCPFVRKHYDSRNMQKLQENYKAKGVVWLSVISSAPGKQGYMEAGEAQKFFAENEKSKPTAILLDTDGSLGKAYDAKTTPHMFVINPQGKVVYAGAIDDNNSANPKVIPNSKNWVASALDAGMAGKEIEKTSSTPYGCSVKYN